VSRHFFFPEVGDGDDERACEEESGTTE